MNTSTLLLVVFALIVLATFSSSFAGMVKRAQESHAAHQAERKQAKQTARVRRVYSEWVADVVAAIEVRDRYAADEAIKPLLGRFHYTQTHDIESLYRDVFGEYAPRVCRRALYSL